jgi:hypothetical protein
MVEDEAPQVWIAGHDLPTPNLCRRKILEDFASGLACSAGNRNLASRMLDEHSNFRFSEQEVPLWRLPLWIVNYNNFRHCWNAIMSPGVGQNRGILGTASARMRPRYLLEPSS